MTGTGSSWSLSVQRREAADRQREGKCQRQRCITRWSRGETLWGIARAWGMTLGELLVLNPQIKNPNVIQPGQRLRVRG